MVAASRKKKTDVSFAIRPLWLLLPNGHMPLHGRTATDHFIITILKKPVDAAAISHSFSF
jgi:hypothetical protein